MSKKKTKIKYIILVVTVGTKQLLSVTHINSMYTVLTALMKLTASHALLELMNKIVYTTKLRLAPTRALSLLPVPDLAYLKSSSIIL